jgi:hypothetical protein
MGCELREVGEVQRGTRALQGAERIEKDPSLARWIVTQRINYNNGELSTERLAGLDSIGFEWDPLASDWDQNFAKLAEFKEEHGHCRVPAVYKIDPDLGHWIRNQRDRYKKGKIHPDRITKLESLGFEWELLDVEWVLNLEKLEIFKAQHGHCRVPQHYNLDPQFGQWVSRQRTFHSKGKLSPSRIASLEAINFLWDPLSHDWEVAFSRLQAFKQAFGHCRVPSTYQADSQLALWVARQRRIYSKGKLSSDRIMRLEALGFEWAPQVGGPREKRKPNASTN